MVIVPVCGYEGTLDGGMRVLVTGGAGFIGANLVRHLSARNGYEITVLDNLSAGQEFADLPPTVHFMRGDFTDRSTIERALRGIDAVVHLAALSGVIDSVEDPRPSFQINVAGTFQLLEMTRGTQVRCIINASTGGALLGEVTPPINEAMAPSPLSPYGASKLAVEGYCSAFAASYGLSCATLRFSNIYGPRSGHKKSVVAAFIKNVLRDEPLTVFGDGSQQRDYLYVGDLVRAIESALHHDLKGSFQLGSGRPTSLLELIGALHEVTGRNPHVDFRAARAGEVHRTWCDISKARREFGYSAPTVVLEGLGQTWDWFVANRRIWDRQMVLSSSD
jgi:UDP-glucose 4-epimerase